MGSLVSAWRARSRLAGTCALVLGVSGVLTPFHGLVYAESQTELANILLAGDVVDTPPPYPQINENGFGNCMNSYSWSMAWFKGNLYVGTNKGSFFQFLAFIDPEFQCQGTDPSVDTTAEIWRYSPVTDTWDLVFESPADVEIWGQPGVFIGRDNGFRDMMVFTESDGTESLYVGGVIYPFINDPRRARLLRSTDGITFEPVPQDPGTLLGDLLGTSFRAMAAYQGRFYVTSGSVFGEGIILEAEDPAGGNDNFRQVSPPGMLGFELITFNDYLFVGTGEVIPFKGFDVLKTDATPNGTPYYDFVPVVTNGAHAPYFLGPNNAVLSMEVYQGRLYVGGQTDLIRINPDDTWELVVGETRQTPQGEKLPLSGLPGGFGNWYTGHLWRMEEHDGSLYVGTWDTAVFFRLVPFLGPFANLESGFDLWRTEDGGATWSNITRAGIARKFNHGVRSLQSTPFGLYLGTVNPWDGTQVYQVAGAPAVSEGSVSASAGQLDQASFGAPLRLEAESQGRDFVLSWDPSPRVVQYQVVRATHASNRELLFRELPSDAWIAGAYTSVGTTTRSFYRDSTVEDGYRYTYYVRAQGEQGQFSGPSNVVLAPSLVPAVTFDRVQATLRDLVRRHKIKSAGTEFQLSWYLGMARYTAETGLLWLTPSLLETLRRTIREKPAVELDPLAAEDLERMVAKLARRVNLARSRVIPIWGVLGEGR